jgi:hypothetical protein
LAPAAAGHAATSALATMAAAAYRRIMRSPFRSFRPDIRLRARIITRRA